MEENLLDDDGLIVKPVSSLFSKIVLICGIIICIVIAYGMTIALSQKPSDQEESLSAQVLIFGSSGIGLIALIISFYKNEPWGKIRITGTILFIVVTSLIYGGLGFFYYTQQLSN